MSAPSGTFPVQAGYVLPALGKTDSFEKSFPTAAPNYLIYNDIQNQPIIENQITFFNAENNTSFTPDAQFIPFTLKSRDLLDFTMPHGFIAFSAACTASDGSPIAFQNGIWNWISRIKLYVGSITLVDQQLKNVYDSMIYAFARAPNFDSTIGAATCGISDFATRQGWSTGKTYAIPISIPMLTSEQQIMANIEGYRLEVYMAPARSCIAAAPGTSPTASFNYTITNPKIYCREVKYQPDIRGDLVAISPVTYPYINYKVFQTQVQVGQTSVDFSIPLKVQSLLRFLVFLRPNADLNNPFITDSLTTDFQKSGTANYQLRIDNDYWPRTPINCGGVQGPEQAYLECIQNMDRAEIGGMDPARMSNNGGPPIFNLDNFAVTMDSFITNRHLMTLDLRATRDNDPFYLNKFDTTPGNVQLILQLRLDPGMPAVPSTLYVFAVHASLAQIFSDGAAKLIE